MSAALTLMAKERGDVPLVQQVLFYPVTGYTTDENQRAEITASPLRATVDQLQGLPRALVIAGEADVLRDEGEAHASKLSQAGVPVTAVHYQGIIHDFFIFNALRDTHAAEAAVKQAVATLRRGPRRRVTQPFPSLRPVQGNCPGRGISCRRSWARLGPARGDGGGVVFLRAR